MIGESKKKWLYVLIFFTSYLIIGLSVYKDYGIPWDEPTHREIAGVSVKYVASKILPDFQQPQLKSLPSLVDYSAKHYGVIFDFPMFVIDMLLGYNGSMPEAYYMRHLFTFILFFISSIFFYKIVRNRFNSCALGLFGCLLLALSPRIFAESFYGKDVVFLSLYIIAIYFFIRYLNNKSYLNSLFFAVATALLVGQRVVGVIVPVIAVLITLLDVAREEKERNHYRKNVYTLLVYMGFSGLLIVLFWPYLWDNPVKNIFDSLLVMNRFPITYYNLYWGEFIKSTEVPWHYIPVWMMITTPLLYSFFFVLGFFHVVRSVILNGIKIYRTDIEREDFLYLLLLFVPMTAVIVLNSALYDGWRHMYFVYAPFLLIAMSGLAGIIRMVKESHTGRERIAAYFIAAVILLGMLSTAYQMICMHPFQNVYFNILAGDNVGKKFDLDYWGLSFRKALENIVKNDQRPVIALSANVPIPMFNNSIYLDKKDIRRLRHADIHQADYFITNYRWHPQSYPLNNEVFAITVDKVKIISVYKLR